MLVTLFRPTPHAKQLERPTCYVTGIQKPWTDRRGKLRGWNDVAKQLGSNCPTPSVLSVTKLKLNFFGVLTTPPLAFARNAAMWGLRSYYVQFVIIFCSCLQVRNFSLCVRTEHSNTICICTLAVHIYAVCVSSSSSVQFVPSALRYVRLIHCKLP